MLLFSSKYNCLFYNNKNRASCNSTPYTSNQKPFYFSAKKSRFLSQISITQNVPLFSSFWYSRNFYNVYRTTNTLVITGRANNLNPTSTILGLGPKILERSFVSSIFHDNIAMFAHIFSKLTSYVTPKQHRYCFNVIRRALKKYTSLFIESQFSYISITIKGKYNVLGGNRKKTLFLSWKNYKPSRGKSVTSSSARANIIGVSGISTIAVKTSKYIR